MVLFFCFFLFIYLAFQTICSFVFMIFTIVVDLFDHDFIKFYSTTAKYSILVMRKVIDKEKKDIRSEF